MPEFDADLEELRNRAQPANTPLGSEPTVDNAELNIEEDLAQIRNSKGATPAPVESTNTSDTVMPRPLTKDELAVDKLDLSLRHAAQSNPAEEAKRRELANRLGVDKAMLPEGDQANQEIFLKENDPEALIRSNPEIAAYLDDLDNAAVAGQDVSALKQVSDVMRRIAVDPLVATA